jgi:fatty-acyl-CoA synthase
MGLIGFMLAPLVHRVPIVFMPPLLFLKRPVTWFQTITRHKGTIAYAPNFAFALCSKRVRERDLGGLDLSTWRVAGCGAEPIRPETLETFCDAFGKIGFRKEALFPSYGMAESSLGIAFSPLGRGMRAIAFDGDRLFSESVAAPVADEAESAVRLVSCGPSFPGHEIVIFPPEDTDGTSAPLPERQVGEIRIKGPSVMHGYWEDAERTRDTFAGAYMRTGDLGFLHDGELYICGRSKEVIILNGRNYYPQDLEWEASRVPGVRKGNVIAFGTADASGEREKVVLAFEVQDVAVAPEQAKAHGQAVAALVRKAVQEGTGLTLDDVVPLAAGALPKTSSGKLQRTRTRELYEVGELATRRSAREKDRTGLVKEAARSQLSYLKLAILGKRNRK